MQLNIIPEKTALIVIDLQKGIVGLKGAPHSTGVVVDNCVQLAAAFRSAGGFVVLVRVAFHDGEDALHPITDRPVTQTAGARPADFSEIVADLGPKQSDLIVTKRQWGAFFGTDLDLQLRRRGIDTIVLSGIATNIGVETTAREAFQHNYQQIFVSDAMTGLSTEEHDHSLKYIFPRMGVIRSTQEVVTALARV